MTFSFEGMKAILRKAQYDEEGIIGEAIEYLEAFEKELKEKHDEALAEPSDEVDKLDNLEKLFEEILGETTK